VWVNDRVFLKNDFPTLHQFDQAASLIGGSKIPGLSTSPTARCVIMRVFAFTQSFETNSSRFPSLSSSQKLSFPLLLPSTNQVAGLGLLGLTGRRVVQALTKNPSGPDYCDHCSIGISQLYLFQAQVILATDVEEMIPKFHAELQNVIWVVSICSDPKLKLPVSIWPTDGLKSFLSVCRIFQSPTKARLYISHFGALINALLEQNDGIPLAAEQLYFAFRISQYIVHSLRSEATTVSQKEAGAYVKVAVDIAEASVAAYGLPEDENTQLQVSVAYRNRAVTLPDERNVDEADIYWEKMLSIGHKLFESPLDSSQTIQEHSMSGDFKSTAERLTYFRHLFPNQDLDEERISGFDANRRLADKPWVAAWYPVRKAWWAEHSAIWEGDNDEEQVKIHSKLAEYLEKVDKAQEEAGICGLNKDHRWWPEAYDPVSFQRFIGPQNQLAVASEVLERGD
jgi:hypothetical protein